MKYSNLPRVQSMIHASRIVLLLCDLHQWFGKTAFLHVWSGVSPSYLHPTAKQNGCDLSYECVKCVTKTILTKNTGYELRGQLEKKCERPNHMLTESNWQRKKNIMSLNTKWYCNVCPLSQKKKHSKIAITWLNWLNTHMSSAMIINSFISQKWSSRLNSFNFVGKATTVIKALRDETPG